MQFHKIQHFTMVLIGFFKSVAVIMFEKGNGNTTATAQRNISLPFFIYRKVSNIRRAKCQNLNESRLVLQLSVPNPLKPNVKSIMKM